MYIASKHTNSYLNLAPVHKISIYIIHIYRYTHIYLNIHTYIYIHDTHAYICVYICIYACIYVCINVCIYVCMYICIYIYIFEGVSRGLVVSYVFVTNGDVF